MRLTHKTEYAILALLYLSRLNQGQSALAKDISANQAIPKKFLQQILGQLKQARYVNAVRGKNGGYSLLKTPAQINLAEIVRLFDGPLAPTTAVSKYFYAAAPIEKEKAAIAVLKDIQEYVSKKLEKTTLADLV